jgi:hypothetical protein
MTENIKNAFLTKWCQILFYFHKLKGHTETITPHVHPILRAHALKLLWTIFSLKNIAPKTSLQYGTINANFTKEISVAGTD